MRGGDLKMHRCPVCPKSFPSPYKLQRHYVIHTGQKPFICTVCGKTFTQSDHLKTHVQKLHRLPADRLQDAIGTQNQQAHCDEPSVRMNTCGSRKYSVMPLTVPSSAAFQPEWKREIHKTRNPPKKMLHVGDASVIRSSTVNVVDPRPQERVDSANEDISVYNAYNGSSSHDKQLERCRESGQTFSTEVYSKGHLQSQESSSDGSDMTLKHQCPKCLKTFCSPSKLQRHFLIHTGQKPYSCVICWKTFRQKVHLKSHLSTANNCSARTERKKQRFRNRGQTSGQQPQLLFQQRPTSHLTPVHSSVELELQCKISVNNVQETNVTEIKSDAIVKPEQSDEQERRCLTQKSLKPFRCVICNRSFRFEVNLLRHHETHRKQEELGRPATLQNGNNGKMSDSQEHLPEPDHADPIGLNIVVKPETWSGNCSDYNDSLPLDSELNTSAEQQRETCRSTGEQPRINSTRQCHACLKCFPSVSKLQRHMMTHTGQRPFGCEMCGKRFRQKTHLRVHCRTHLWSRYHKRRSLYINRPPSCLGGFNTRTAADVPVQEILLRKDFETHTGSDTISVKHLDQTPSMLIIQKDTRVLDKLLPHISKKKEVARKVSTAKRMQIVASMQNPRNVQHQCFRCSKCFPSASKLQRHEMVHTGLKPFRCVLCGKAFRQAPHLKTHERTHCERKPSEPVDHQRNIRVLKATRQQQPRISVGVPQQNSSVNTDGMLSNCDGAEGNIEREFPCTGDVLSIRKVNSLFKTNSKSNLTCKKRKLHTCHICFKNFVFPETLSRHLVTHYETRPYKCTLCSKTFTQRVHLKVHEHRCRQVNGLSRYIQGDTINATGLQDKCSESLRDCADLNAGVSREQSESHCVTSVAVHSVTDGDLSYGSEATHTVWLAEPEVGLREESNKLEKRQRDDCIQATCSYDQATDHCSYSFPSELAFEIDKLVQNQNVTALYDDNAHNVEAPFQTKGVTAISDADKLLSEELFSSVVENQMQPANYWCEPLTVLDCDKCSKSFQSENDLKRHICSTNVQAKMPESIQKNRCDVCFKHFVSPSKLQRHYVTHTGQRPFRCDICGKTFTQSAHVRTHRLTH